MREGEGRRYYRYLRDSDTGEFVGEVAYRWDPEYDSFITDVLVHARFRGRGYGGSGLELLCDAASERGIATLRDNVALDNPAIGLFLRHGFDEEWRSDEFVMLRRDLKVGDHTTPVPRAQFRSGEVGVVWSTRLK